MRAVSAHARQAKQLTLLAIESRSAGKPRPRARRPESSSCSGRCREEGQRSANSRDSRARSPTGAGRSSPPRMHGEPECRDI